MSAPINRFRTITVDQVDDNALTPVYVCPENNTAIVLMTQVANLTAPTANFSEDLRRITLVLADADNNVKSTLVSEYELLPRDAANILTGKLVIEERERLLARSFGAVDADNVSLTLSVLESRNA